MVDLYTRIREQPEDVLEVIARALELRAGEPAMQRMAAAYLGAVALPRDARVLEIGCGNGASTRLLRDNLDPAELVCVDPCEGLIALVPESLRADPRLRFRRGEAGATAEPTEAFDAVVAHTVYSHLEDPADALREAHRVLKPGGALAIFDGDYATITVAQFDGDPLESAVAATIRHLIHAPYVMRRLPALVGAAGFEVQAVAPHAYVQTETPDYLLSLLCRGVQAAARDGEFGDELARGLHAEAERRVAAGTFYGAILFVSLLARKPMD